VEGRAESLRLSGTSDESRMKPSDTNSTSCDSTQTRRSSTNIQAQFYTDIHSVLGTFPIVTANKMGLDKQAQRDRSNSQENTEHSLLPATTTNTDEQQKLKDSLEHKINTSAQQLNQDEVERFKAIYVQEVIRLHGEMTELGNKLEQLRVKVSTLHNEVIKKGFSPELSACVQQLAVEAAALSNTTSEKQDVVTDPSKDLLEYDTPLKHPKA
jgi:hypothetical protein